MNYLEQEIGRKLPMLNMAAITARQGLHIAYHIGRTDEDLVKRARDRKEEGKGLTCSTFFSENEANLAIWEFFNDAYALSSVTKWLEKSSDKSEKEFDYDLDSEEEYIGKVLLPNGALKKTRSFRIVLIKNEDRNGAAEMPFTIKNLYPVEEDW